MTPSKLPQFVVLLFFLSSILPTDLSKERCYSYSIDNEKQNTNVWSSGNAANSIHDISSDHSDFSFHRSTRMFKTEAGEFRVLALNLTHISNVNSAPSLGLGFLSLEPKAMLLPHYIDTDSLFLVHKGRGRLTWIDTHDDKLHEIDIEEGDAYKIESGSPFQVLNSNDSQRLYIFSIHDVEHLNGFEDENKTTDIFHNFFFAGGSNAQDVLSGFGEDVLSTAFNVSFDDIHDIVNSKTQGPIIFSKEKNDSSKNVSPEVLPLVNIFLRYVNISNAPENSCLDKPFNILKKTPDFSNDYGSATAADSNDFKQLKDVSKGLFSVKLKAGAVLAPHWNPRATEVALVTKGEGEIRIVYPNGTAAACDRVAQGMVFYVPKNFPMCHVASRSGPFEFVGFSTSSRPNQPQFLAGSNSVLRNWNLEVLAESFNASVKHLERLLQKQREAVILPGKEKEEKKTSSHEGEQRHLKDQKQRKQEPEPSHDRDQKEEPSPSHDEQKRKKQESEPSHEREQKRERNYGAC